MNEQDRLTVYVTALRAVKSKTRPARLKGLTGPDAGRLLDELHAVAGDAIDRALKNASSAGVDVEIERTKQTQELACAVVVKLLRDAGEDKLAATIEELADKDYYVELIALLDRLKP